MNERDESADQPPRVTTLPAPVAPLRRSRWNDVLLAACGLFVITVLLMVATAFSPRGGMVAQLVDRHGLQVLGLEVLAILALAVMVLTVEKRDSGRNRVGQDANRVEGDVDPVAIADSVPSSSEPVERH